MGKITFDVKGFISLVFFFCVSFSLPPSIFAQTDSELQEIIKDYDRPFLDELNRADSLLLSDLRSKKLTSKRTIKVIVNHFLSSKFSNPMKAELANLLLQNNTNSLSAFFHLLPTQHIHSKSLRPYELINFPVANALFSSTKDLTFVNDFLSSKKFWKDCQRLESYGDLPKLFLRGYLEANLTDFQMGSRKSCIVEQYEGLMGLE